MYSKAEMFGDLEIMKQVLETTDPADMKKLGRLIKNFDKEEWDSKAPTIVTIGNLMKFTQNAHLWEILSNTNNKTLVEAADYDSIWGIGLKAEQALLLPESEWKGQNNLGKALMEVRDILKLNPSLVDKPSLEDKKIFNFVDLKGQKIIRLSMKELSKELNCVCTDLQELLSNMTKQIARQYNY
jgi:ribA/ribD-fused uncharacterized protein